jgi:hypothetical protein
VCEEFIDRFVTCTAIPVRRAIILETFSIWELLLVELGLVEPVVGELVELFDGDLDGSDFPGDSYFAHNNLPLAFF